MCFPARYPNASLWLAVAASLWLCGCPRPSFDGTVYRGEGFAFRVPAPPSQWKRVPHSHAALAFRDEPGEASIMLNARCGMDGEDVPLRVLTNHLFLQFTERELHSEEVIPFDGREALHTVMTAKLDGVAMTYDAWVTRKDGCVYDLLYIAPPATFERGLESFRAVVHGFATVDEDSP